MSWDSTLRSTDKKYIHEDVVTNKTRTRSIESRTPSAQMAQAERQNTNVTSWTTVESGERGQEQNKHHESQKWLTLKVIQFTKKHACFVMIPQLSSSHAEN